MFKSCGMILAGALSIAGVAQAQQALIDTTLDVPTNQPGSDTFTLTESASLFIEGAGPSDAQIQGLGFLAQGAAFNQGGTLIDTFALTDGSGNVLFNQFNLAAGTYTFSYDFSNSTDTTGGFVHLEANAIPVAAPEIDPSSAMAGLTLLGGGLATLRGRRFKSKKA